jgi:hypothetical protein
MPEQAAGGRRGEMRERHLTLPIKEQCGVRRR